MHGLLAYLYSELLYCMSSLIVVLFPPVPRRASAGFDRTEHDCLLVMVDIGRPRVNRECEYIFFWVSTVGGVLWKEGENFF